MGAAPTKLLNLAAMAFSPGETPKPLKVHTIQCLEVLRFSSFRNAVHATVIIAASPLCSGAAPDRLGGDCDSGREKDTFGFGGNAATISGSSWSTIQYYELQYMAVAKYATLFRVMLK